MLQRSKCRSHKA